MSEQSDFLDILLENQENMTEKQKKILEAAVETFSEKGYAATSTSEIAKKAGVAEGTIFRHYKTKKDLLLSIVAPTMAKLLAPFLIRDFNKVLLADYGDFEDFLRAVIINRMEFAQKQMPIIKICLQEIPFHPELKSQFIEHVFNKLIDRFKYIVESYQKKGQIIDMPPTSVMRLTASSIIGFILARTILIPESEWDDEQEMERTIQFIVKGLSPDSSK